jgi:hypothetical protein
MLAKAMQNAPQAGQYWKDAANRMRTNVLFPKNTQAQGAIREHFGSQEAAGQAIAEMPGGDLSSPKLDPQGRADSLRFVKTKAGETIGQIRDAAEKAGARVDTDDVFAQIDRAYAKRFGGAEMDAAPGPTQAKARRAGNLVQQIKDTFSERFRPTSTNVGFGIKTPAMDWPNVEKGPVAITHKGTGATVPLGTDLADAPRSSFETVATGIPGDVSVMGGGPRGVTTTYSGGPLANKRVGGDPVASGRPPIRDDGHMAASVKRLQSMTSRPMENSGWGVALEDRFPALPDQAAGPTSTNVEVKGLPLKSWTRLKKTYGDHVNNMKGLYARPDANIKNDPMLAFMNEVDGIIAGAEDAAISRSVPDAASTYARAKSTFGAADTLRGPTQLHADSLAAGNAPGGSSRGNLSSASGIIRTLGENAIASPLRQRAVQGAEALSRYSANPRDEMDPKTIQALLAYYLRNREN